MERLTARGEDGLAQPRAGQSAQICLERLARYEDTHETLCAEYGRVLEQMNVMRQNDKTKTATYRQLIANKLMLGGLIARLDQALR